MSLNSSQFVSKNTSGNIITPIMLYSSPSAPSLSPLSCTHGGLLMSGQPNQPNQSNQVNPVNQQSDKLGHIGNPYYGLYGYGYGYPWYPYHYGNYCGYGGYCRYRGLYGYPWYF